MIRFPRACVEPPRANALRGLTDHVHPAGVFIIPLPDLAKSEDRNHFKHHLRDEEFEELDQVVFYLFPGCNDPQSLS